MTQVEAPPETQESFNPIIRISLDPKQLDSLHKYSNEIDSDMNLLLEQTDKLKTISRRGLYLLLNDLSSHRSLLELVGRGIDLNKSVIWRSTFNSEQNQKIDEGLSKITQKNPRGTDVFVTDRAFVEEVLEKIYDGPPFYYKRASILNAFNSGSAIVFVPQGQLS